MLQKYKKPALAIVASVAIGALLTFSIQPSWQTAADKVENSLGVVRFPEVWSKSSVEGRTIGLVDTSGFAVRKKIGSQPELIFRMKGLISIPSEDRSESVYSDQCYAVSLDRQFRVRAANSDEWERAEQLPNTRQQILSNKHGASSQPPSHTEGAVSYRGTVFPKTGDFWGNPVGLVSPNGTWLAVFSFSSSAKPRRSWSPLDGGMLNEPMPGKMFIDVYDTSSRQRIQSGSASYEGSPSMLFGGALWVGDSYLVVPLDPVKFFDAAGQACFLGILPTRTKT